MLIHVVCTGHPEHSLFGVAKGAHPVLSLAASRNLNLSKLKPRTVCLGWA